MSSISTLHPGSMTSTAPTVTGALANLIESRTVLEKKQFVSTGILTYIEGDIVEVEISQWDIFSLGDPLKVTMYSPMGILNFESTIVAKNHGSVILIVPPDIQRRFMDKRQYPRVDVKQNGILNRAYKTASRQSAIELPSPIEIVTTDLSLGGVGFIVETGDFDFKPNMLIEAELEIGFTLHSVLEVVRKSPFEGGMFYGAKMLDIPQDKETSLRAFILRTQVSNYFKQKKLNR